jgi:hypothetical protein
MMIYATIIKNYKQIAWQWSMIWVEKSNYDKDMKSSTYSGCQS